MRFERVLRAVQDRPALRSLPHAIDLVEELLEPQLVDLVDDDEQHLVVLGRARLLQGQELLDFQVGGIRTCSTRA